VLFLENFHELLAEDIEVDFHSHLLTRNVALINTSTVGRIPPVAIILILLSICSISSLRLLFFKFFVIDVTLNQLFRKL
jgi:hypothetical protein